MQQLKIFFPDQLKKSELHYFRTSKELQFHYLKKRILYRRRIIGPWAYYLMYQRLLRGQSYKQINIYMQDKLSKPITGFRKSHGTQHSLMTLLGNWKGALDKGENICVLFMDLSKTFNTVNHDLILAKLKSFGFSTNALDLLCYLKNWNQSLQINNNFSSGKKIYAGVP